MAGDGYEDRDGTSDLVARAVQHGLLRQALELAVVVARSGAEARPPIPPPHSLRPLLRHVKWTTRARTSVARVLETDEEFRMRVAEAAERLDADRLGTASRLWLVRPEGWQEDLADAVRELDAAEQARRADREDRQAKRKVGELSAEVERHRQEAEAALRRAADFEAELGEARRERRETAALAERLGEELAGVQAEAERWRRSAEEAECLAGEHRRALEEARQELTELRGEEGRLRDRIAQLQGQLTEAEARQEAEDTATADLRQSVARAVGEAATAAAALGEALAGAARSIVERASVPPESALPASPGSESPTGGPSGGCEPAHSRCEPADVPSNRVLGKRGGGERALAWLATSPETTGPRPATGFPERPTFPDAMMSSEPARSSAPARASTLRSSAEPGGPSEATNPSALTQPAGEGSAAPQRQPRPLPPAVFDDSPEAAAHLVRTGVLLLVDGYNVSLFAWPELSLPAQRHRVTTSLAELAARTGASVRVIFDGDEQVAYPETRAGARTPVRVLFSTPGVDADEVIIGLVDEHPPDRAVVVATNDRRVQEEVRRRGANVLTTPQLLGLLRRTATR